MKTFNDYLEIAAGGDVQPSVQKDVQSNNAQPQRQKQEQQTVKIPIITKTQILNSTRVVMDFNRPVKELKMLGVKDIGRWSAKMQSEILNAIGSTKADSQSVATATNTANKQNVKEVKERV